MCVCRGGGGSSMSATTLAGLHSNHIIDKCLQTIQYHIRACVFQDSSQILTGYPFQAVRQGEN